MKLYYYIKTGRTVGPVTLEELHDQLTAGELTSDSLACLAGAEEWIPLRTILAKAQSEACGEAVKACSKGRISWEKMAILTLLAMIIALLVIIISALKSNNKEITGLSEQFAEYEDRQKKTRPPEYMYRWINLSSDSPEFNRALEDKRYKYFERYNFEFFGWEYAGPLCSDGRNGMYILLRKQK